jgi:protochlorophyllide reductase
VQCGRLPACLGQGACNSATRPYVACGHAPRLTFSFSPSLPLSLLLLQAKWSKDNIEQQLQINHLSHFLLCSLLINDVAKAKKGRMIIVGSITGNTNTIGGGAVYPLSDLGELKGLAAGAKNPVAMIDGKEFNGAKAYKDAKICNMMTVNELHKRYHKSTGITFSSIYPGCIAETQLFREKREWFRKLFPLFMKYVTGGYVSQREAGERLAQVVASPECEKSGVYWSWNGGARQVPVKDFSTGIVRGTGGSGGEIFENTPSNDVANPVKSGKMWDLSSKVTGAVWPKVKEAALV